jgi:hypothetical protein
VRVIVSVCVRVGENICGVCARGVSVSHARACTLTRVDGRESMVMKKMYSENDISPSPLRSTCDHTYHENH